MIGVSEPGRGNISGMLIGLKMTIPMSSPLEPPI